MSLAGRALNAADNLMQRTLDGTRTASAALTALWWPRRKSDLKGHACHCPPGAPLHLLHSEGLREAADLVVDYGSNVGSPHRFQVPPRTLARIAPEVAPGDIVHVKAELLGEFVAHVMPAIRAPFVLVTGDSDFSPVARHRDLLEDRRIAHWFAQNCDIPDRHPRLTRIPIGTDNPRYTKMEKRIGLLVEMALGKSPADPSLSLNDIGNQKRMQEIARENPAPVQDKPLRALCTFHMNQKLVPDFSGIPDRRDAYDILTPNPACHFVPRRLLQEECWRAHAGFAFEISPRGNGIDCFRTWEALFLNTIPIVRTTTLDPLYQDEDLPVVIVESWREVTEANLARWRDALQDRFTAGLTRKLGNDYWVEKIRIAAAAARQKAF
jgi:hypothetical protein